MASSSKTWADLFSSSSSEDEENYLSGTDNDEAEDIIYKEMEFSEVDKSNCVCKNFLDADSALNYMTILSDIDITDELYQCNLDTLINIINYFLENHTELNDAYRLAFCDNFYRLRHEVLFKFLCRALNLDITKSDVKFSKFGIPSDRTPDMIIEDFGELLIIEVSASSSYEKAAMSKGLAEAGFESKYKPELEMLDEIGVKNIYVPFLFDMTNPGNLEYEKGFKLLPKWVRINESYKMLLKSVKETLCLNTIHLREYLLAPSSILFSKMEPIKKDHSELNFLCTVNDNESTLNKKVYKEFYISPPVYNKLINNWHRLEGIIGRYPDNDKVSLILDTSTHKLFCSDLNGNLTVRELLDAVYKNDKFKVFNNLQLKLGKSFVKAMDSNDGVKFIDTTNERHVISFKTLDRVLNHEPVYYTTEGVGQFPLTRYKEKLQIHFSYNYKFKYYDPDFEEKFVDLILKKDMDNIELKGSSSENNDYFLSDNNFISQNKLDKIDIKQVFDDLKLNQLSMNQFDEKLPLKIQKNKNPFTIPLAQITESSYTTLNFKNEKFIDSIVEEIASTDPYTSVILTEVLREDFEFIQDIKNPSSQYMSLLEERRNISREITKLHREYYKVHDKKGLLKLKDCGIEPFKSQFNSLNRRVSELGKLIEKRGKLENVKNQTQLIRLPSKNRKTVLGGKFDLEMSHYKNKNMQSCITGIGYRSNMEDDFKNDVTVYDQICSWLTMNAGENPNLFFDGTPSDDCKLLSELKNLAKSDYENLINTAKNSFLGHSASFVSNMAHSLLYYSQMPFNSDYIRVDNLGYKDVLLIVRGGKKIFKSKASKMFRVIYPINDCIRPWIETGSGMKSSTKILNIGNKCYLLTPWQQMHESTLNDSISFYTRVLSFVVLNLDPKIDLKFQFPKVSFNVLLSYHNRRHTEVILANLRYILLATLGDYTGIKEIFSEFMGFNYDCFQSFIRGCVIKNYPMYFNNLKKVKDIKSKTPNFTDYINEKPEHLFTGYRISSEEDLALMIYSTFLMTKAPYQRPAERARNLKGILEIHSYFDKNVGLDLTLTDFYKNTTVNISDFNDLKDYSQRIFSNDFYFDASYCAQLGVFADSYYKSRYLKEEIFNKWSSILVESWDELATSTGLRGKFDDLSNFWGQKGYFVVYKDLVSDKSYMSAVENLLTIEMDIDKKRKLLRDLNIIYKAKLEESKEYLIFHAVDKVQWRGGREIYVMDIDTKTIQQPIEKFMGFLCQKLDNELISIPSDRRAQVIHHSIFEKDLPMKDTLTWYLTLDCSKWAPKSNYLKFITMLLCMDVIPSTFKTHFLNYCQKLFKKRIYFNEAEVDVLKNNKIYESVVRDYLKYDELRKGYFLLMPYSWVMGIFNYTSSFMHAINQKYSEYIIFKTGLISYGEEATLHMFAHSDDSGGRLVCQNDLMLTRCLTLYELQLKMCNHLLSKKKSVVSRFYFEILSVIYIFKKLLALLPKFLGGLRFTPSDKGPAQDMLTSYSKCIEVMVSGASFNVAYLVMKFYSFMVFRFYYHKNRKISKENFDCPVQYLGLPDAHPLMVLLCGSDADIVRILHTRGKESLAKLHALNNNLINTIEDDGPIKPIKFNITVRGLKKGFEEHIDKFKNILNTWSISNVNYHSTPFNLMAFLKKLSDPGFVGSLVNESTTRRLSRAYYMRKGSCISSTLGLITIENYLDYRNLILFDNRNLKSILPNDVVDNMLNEIKNSADNSLRQMEILEETLVSPMRICRYMDELSITGRQIVQTNRTLKPTHVELVKSTRTFTTRFDPAQMVSYLKEPELSWALPNIRDMFTGKLEVENLCHSLGYDLDKIEPSTLLKLCRNYSAKYKKEIYLYSQIPGEIRNIKTYSAFLTFLSTNTYMDKEIKGLILNLRKNLTDPGYLNINIDEDVYIINNILSILQIFIRACGIDFLNQIELKPIKIIGWSGGSINSLFDYLTKLSRDLRSEHFSIQLNYLKDKAMMKFAGECSAHFLNESSYYYFPKPQRSKTGWFGYGELMVVVKDRGYRFNLYNNLVISIECTYSGKIMKDDMSFIFDVLNKSGLQISNRKIGFKNEKSFDLIFGVDYNGDYSIGKNSEIDRGLPALFNPVMRTLTKDREFLTIDFLNPNTFLLVQSEILGGKRFKIYTLPLIQGEILNLIKMMFKPSDFEEKMLTEGLNDFEEFILTEIMTDFGFETYVNPYDLFDNYQSSKIFKIFKEVKEKSISKIPAKMHTTQLPANEGGLLRILIDYSSQTNEKIIKAPGNLTPEIMELRSQYPETVSVILSEKLVDFHNKIYNEEERDEIKESYQKLYKYTNFEELRTNVVKLMTHWGYGSMVNSLENYTLAKEDKNYFYFGLKKFENMNSALSSDLFIDLNRIIIVTMREFRNILSTLDLPIPNLKIKDFDLFCSEYITTIVNSLFKTNINFCNYCVNYSVFLNYLIAMMSDDDFLTRLRLNLDKNYILCAINVTYQKRRIFIALYNSLLFNFININSSKNELDYTLKLHRLKDDITHPKNIYNSIKNKGLEFIKDYKVNYFNFLNNDLISMMKESISLNASQIDYRISQEVKKRSRDIIPVSGLLSLNNVYNPEIFETEDWEEILATIEMGDAEQEDIDEYYENIKGKFLKPKTKKLPNKNPTVQTLLTWVIDPFIFHRYETVEYYRQCGENLIIVGTEIIPKFLKFFPNTHCRRVNFSKRLKTYCPDMILNISCNKLLTMEFWDKFLGGQVIDYSSFIFSKIYHGEVILKDGVVGEPSSLGVSFEESVESQFGEKPKEQSKESVDESTINEEEDKKTKSKDEFKVEIINKVNDYYERGVISRGLRRRLIDKYTKSDIINVYSIEELFLNCLNELMLGDIKNSLTNDSSSFLKKEEYVKVFLAPTHFGLAQNYSRNDPKNIKDKKVLAEINCLCDKMASMVASGTLSISKNYYKIIQSHYKMWVNSTKGTNYKRENKKFMLIYFLTLINTAKVLDDQVDDGIWRNIVDLFTPYIADDGPESGEDDNFLDFDTNIIAGSRLIYKAVGF